MWRRIRVKGNSVSFVQRQEEEIKFNHLLRMLVWAKSRTGKSSAEITSIILRKGKDGIEW
jgi:hypothetical protein